MVVNDEILLEFYPGYIIEVSGETGNCNGIQMYQVKDPVVIWFYQEHVNGGRGNSSATSDEYGNFFMIVPV